MKILKEITICILLSMIAISCSDNAAKNGEKLDGGINYDAVLNRKSKDPDAKGENVCLLGYQTKYDQLLTEEDVINATGFTKESMTIKYNTTLSDPKYHEFMFKFKNGRKEKLTSSTLAFDVPDVVVIRSIEAMSINAFTNSYRAATAEELEAANAAMNDVADGNSNNEDAEAVMKKAKEMNVTKEDIKKSGKTLNNAFSEVTKAYVTITDLGDLAVWNTKVSELNVLQDGVKFSIRTDLGEDNTKNRDVAIALAKIVLKKCD